MSYFLKQNQTARPLLFLMVDSADHISPKTALAPTVTLSKNGAAFAAPAGAITEIGSGWYKVAGNATDANTLGILGLHATAAGADPSDVLYEVVAFDPADAAGLGLSNLDATVGSRATVTGVLDQADAVETGLTLRKALRLLTAVLGGKVSGAGSTTVTFRNALADSKARVTATVDAYGNRSAQTLDLD